MLVLSATLLLSFVSFLLRTNYLYLPSSDDRPLSLPSFLKGKPLYLPSELPLYLPPLGLFVFNTALPRVLSASGIPPRATVLLPPWSEEQKTSLLSSLEGAWEPASGTSRGTTMSGKRRPRKGLRKRRMGKCLGGVREKASGKRRQGKAPSGKATGERRPRKGDRGKATAERRPRKGDRGKATNTGKGEQIRKQNVQINEKPSKEPPGCVLSGKGVLPYRTLPYCSLPYCALPDCSLPHCALPYCALPYCSLQNCSLTYCSLPYCSLPYGSLPDSALPNCALP